MDQNDIIKDLIKTILCIRKSALKIHYHSSLMEPLGWSQKESEWIIQAIDKCISESGPETKAIIQDLYSNTPKFF